MAHVCLRHLPDYRIEHHLCPDTDTYFTPLRVLSSLFFRLSVPTYLRCRDLSAAAVHRYAFLPVQKLRIAFRIDHHLSRILLCRNHRNHRSADTLPDSRPVSIQLRSLNPRTFFAGVLGLLTPYWLGSCYLLYKGNWLERAREFRQQLIPVISDYNLLGWDQYLSLGILLVITLLCTAQSLTQTYQDKVQTRILLRTLMALEIIIIAFILLLPASFNGLFPMLLICSSVFFGHFFALVFNRFTQISLWIIFILLGIMTLFNVWMHFYII